MGFNILFTKIYKRKVDDNRGVEADRNTPFDGGWSLLK